MTTSVRVNRLRRCHSAVGGRCHRPLHVTDVRHYQPQDPRRSSGGAIQLDQVKTWTGDVVARDVECGDN